MDVVLVSRGRQDLLCVTLSSLFSQVLNEPIRIHLALHQEEPMSYALAQMMRLAHRLGINVHVSVPPLTQSLASIRAELIEQAGSKGAKWVMMLDNDVWFPPNTFQRLKDEAKRLHHERKKKILAVCLGHVDVWNERDYPDFSLKPYQHVDEYREKHSHTGECFQRYQQEGQVNYSHTHAIWNIDNLIEAGVIDLWKNWPVGVREYDYRGSLKGIEHGFECWMASSKDMETAIPLDQRVCRIAFWHLWTKKDDTGYFDVKGQFLPEKTK